MTPVLGIQRQEGLCSLGTVSSKHTDQSSDLQQPSKPSCNPRPGAETGSLGLTVQLALLNQQAPGSVRNPVFKSKVKKGASKMAWEVKVPAAKTVFNPRDRCGRRREHVTSHAHHGTSTPTHVCTHTTCPCTHKCTRNTNVIMQVSVDE